MSRGRPGLHISRRHDDSKLRWKPMGGARWSSDHCVCRLQVGLGKMGSYNDGTPSLFLRGRDIGHIQGASYGGISFLRWAVYGIRFRIDTSFTPDALWHCRRDTARGNYRSSPAPKASINDVNYSSYRIHNAEPTIDALRQLSTEMVAICASGCNGGSNQ